MGLKYFATNICSLCQNTSRGPVPFWHQIFCELLPIQGQLEELILFTDHDWKTANDERMMSTDGPITFKDIPAEWLGRTEKSGKVKEGLEEFFDQVNFISDAERERLKLINVKFCKVICE
ncbi:hypothetical protein BDZ45DRAFT_675786 [Acephala macrosclerotiorum]|nr:hypothetical protein BDZ45DRAFT_675786 [Acephala macrosclerotiorum]